MRSGSGEAPPFPHIWGCGSCGSGPGELAFPFPLGIYTCRRKGGVSGCVGSSDAYDLGDRLFPARASVLLLTTTWHAES